MVLAENGNVGDDIHGGDVGSENDNTAGDVMGALAAGMGDLRRALTTSLTPRLRDLLTAAMDIQVSTNALVDRKYIAQQ